MTLEILVDDRSALAERAAAELVEAVRTALAARGRCAIAVAGGSIAQAFFPRFVDLPLDWDLIDVFWADERDVPPDHPDSNYGAAHALWLAPAGVPPARVHRMFATGGDQADAYARELERAAGSPPALDLALLGIGPDGHLASLFPDHPALEADRPVVIIDDSPKPPPRRMTLTLSVLARTRRVVIGALGASKAAAVAGVLRAPHSTSPAARLTHSTARPLWLVDLEAWR